MPNERLAPTTLPDDEALHLEWRCDEILASVLFEARVGAGSSMRCLTRFWHTLKTDKRIIRLAANGHTNASIAELMESTEGTIQNRRQRIRRLLEHLLPLDAFVEYDRTSGNQQQACGIQSTYPHLASLRRRDQAPHPILPRAPADRNGRRRIWCSSRDQSPAGSTQRKPNRSYRGSGLLRKRLAVRTPRDEVYQLPPRTAL